MKLTLSVFIALFLSAGAACAQQAASAPTSSVAATGATQPRSVGGQGSGGFVSSGRSSTMRIIGTPTNQPNPGRDVECSPIEQGIAGLIIGPTDLCDR
jgi:nitrous oxide reductase